MLVPLCLADEPRHRLYADAELPGNIMLQLMLHQDPMNDSNLIADSYAGAALLPFAPGMWHHLFEIRLADGFGD